MDSPGSYFLLIGGTDFQITNAGTYVGDWLPNLDGMMSVSVLFDFRAGTNGGEADVRAYLQTSLDDGNTPFDIACSAFTSSQRRIFNVATESSSAPSVATDAALSDETVLAGVLGNRLRLKVVSTGSWSNTFLGCRLVVR